MQIRFSSTLSYFLLLVLSFVACKTEQQDFTKLDSFSQSQPIKWNKTLTKVMIEDIFTPPVCSRIYAYPNIAAYEVNAAFDTNYPSYAGNLNELTAIPQPKEGLDYYPPLSSMIAFSTVGKALVFGQEKIQKAEDSYLNEIKKLGLSKKLYDNSINYGRIVGQHIIEWSDKDGYLERTAKAQFTLSKDPGKWKPTPPDYQPAIEPHWNTLRTFVLDSADHFIAEAPTEYSTNKNSTFFKEAEEVYATVNNLDEEKISIAKFWDCNPNVSHTKGHLVFFDQKISPGGHWISITGIALEKENKSWQDATKIFSLNSIAMADAFISCWDEKYKSTLIRPESYINQHIDKEWKPILQTPAFPEHTSGHSVVSSTAAVILTDLLGENFSFVDSTEVVFGLPIRNFESFNQAAEEAAISRLYGGIHYVPAIEKGVVQGKRIGAYIADKLKKYK